MNKFFFDDNNKYSLISKMDIDWKRIENKTFLITGSTGLVGTFFIYSLLNRNKNYNSNIKIYAVGRNEDAFYSRFGVKPNLFFIKSDVRETLNIGDSIDFIIHLASNTHPILYATDPIGTEMTNIIGTLNLLELASHNPNCRFILGSSGDVYGDNRSEKPFISETDYGYVDCNTLRAGYIEGKRASEALCNAYYAAKNVDFVIARLCRVYGQTMRMSDSKAISQFIINAVNGEKIVLKSSGVQTFSYLHVFDVVSALIYILIYGKSGEAYNVADNNQTASLKELAEVLAEIGESEVVIDEPDNIEKKGASTFKDVRLDATKLYGLGWKAQIGMKDGLRETVVDLREININ